jgi:hypothetical protein
MRTPLTKWIVLVTLGFACKREPADVAADAAAPQPPASVKKRGRATPICAQQDCATKQMVDDGCDDEGRCLSCVNVCDPPP